MIFNTMKRSGRIIHTNNKNDTNETLERKNLSYIHKNSTNKQLKQNVGIS